MITRHAAAALLCALIVTPAAADPFAQINPNFFAGVVSIGVHSY